MGEGGGTTTLGRACGPAGLPAGLLIGERANGAVCEESEAQLMGVSPLSK
jgi:hypothetical protein